MARSRSLAELLRYMRLARACDDRRISSREGIERSLNEPRASRRQLLLGASALAAAGTFGRVLTACGPREASESVGKGRFMRSGAVPRVAIIGAGIAGLVCADRLQKQGILATIYEANSRVGGRCYSNREFAGHVGENGGEMIDNAGKTMLGYANEFGLALEDYEKQPGETVFHFQGNNYVNADIVDQFRLVVARAQADLKTLSVEPTAFNHTDADVALDNLSLQAWLDSRCGDLPLLRSMLSAAYISEYGRDPAEQSCLNLLYFLHFDHRSKFKPYGSSDERYHVVGGNDQIPNLIRDRLLGPVITGATLTALAKNTSTGEVELSFRETTAVATFDIVVVAIPFTVLRRIRLDPSLGLPPEKVRAIQQLGYGYNGKTEVLFHGRPWAKVGSDGAAYADLPNMQNTWETNWTGGDGSTTILTEYFGGALGFARQMLAQPGATGVSCGSCHGSGANFHPARLDHVNPQAEAFLADFDRVFPGAAASVVRNADGSPAIHRAHWLPQSYSRGSYTCYLPGQFTTLAGWEGLPVGNLLFAGEHADSFYNWQGFLEGAAQSGVAAAQSILGSHAGGNQ